MNRMRPIPDEARPNSGGGTPMDMQTAMSIASEYGHVPQKLDGGGDPNNPNPVGIWGVPTENGYVEMGQLMQPGAGWNQQGDKYGYGGGGGNGGGNGGEWNRPLGGGGSVPEWAKSYDGNPFSQPRSPASPPPVAATASPGTAMSNPDYPYSPQYDGGQGGVVGQNVARGLGGGGAVRNGPGPVSPFSPPPAAAAQQGIAAASQDGGGSAPQPSMSPRGQTYLPQNPGPGQVVRWPVAPAQAQRSADPPAPSGANTWTSLNSYTPPGQAPRQAPLPPGGNQGFTPTPAAPARPNQGQPAAQDQNGYVRPQQQFQLSPQDEQRRNQIYGTTQQQGFAPQAPRAPQPRMLTIEMDDGTKVTYDAQKKAWIV
jgi:hypothetical protein